MKNDLLDRSKKFALDIISFSKSTKKTFENMELLRQLLRSATSTAANYRAAQRARSQAEFRAKICIVVEECDESHFWLEIGRESGCFEGAETIKLKQEAEELTKIFNIIKFKSK